MAELGRGSATRKAGGGGVGMTPGCIAVCSWRRLLPSRHLPLPFPPQAAAPIGLPPPRALPLPAWAILTSLHCLLFPRCANGAPGLSLFHGSVPGPHGGEPLARYVPVYTPSRRCGGGGGFSGAVGWLQVGCLSRCSELPLVFCGPLFPRAAGGWTPSVCVGGGGVGMSVSLLTIAALHKCTLVRPDGAFFFLDVVRGPDAFRMGPPPWKVHVQVLWRLCLWIATRRALPEETQTFFVYQSLDQP